jgi:hypothetical protein
MQSVKRYSFQVNLHFTEEQVSAAGVAPVLQTNLFGTPETRTVVCYARSLGWLPRKIMRKTGLSLEQIELTFQPECLK